MVSLLDGVSIKVHLGMKISEHFCDIIDYGPPVAPEGMSQVHLLLISVAHQVGKVFADSDINVMQVF